MKIIKLLLILFLFGHKIFAQNMPKNGLWRAEIPTAIGLLPFHILIENSKAYAINGKEKLEFDPLFIKNDSVHLKIEMFDAEIVAKVTNAQMQGVYTKKMGNLSTRSGVFNAVFNKPERFFNGTKNTKHNVNGIYEVVFTSEKNSYDAVGVFNQKNDQVTGTFLTTTGDYRYLSGNIVEDSLKLSTFDGTHIYYFKAKIENNNLVGGTFCSSLTNLETWSGIKNAKAALPDAEHITLLKPGFSKLAFSFADENGQLISNNDARFKNKVTIVQILGSWCPNCMDETKFLTAFSKNHPNVEIVGLAFEKSLEPAFIKSKFDNLRKRFDIRYPLLIAGKNSTKEASEKLPMLNQIISFPTSIVIDKKGNVRKIHTGFSGPGTGVYYTQFVNSFSRFIEKLEHE